MNYGVWIGENLPENNRVLILGESHYGDDNQVGEPVPYATSDVVKEYIEGRTSGSWSTYWFRFFDKIVTSFGYSTENCKEFFDKVCFGNYVPVLCGVKENNKAESFIKRERTAYNNELFQFVKNNRIDIVVCFSIMVYNNLPATHELDTCEDVELNEAGKRSNTMHIYRYKEKVKHGSCDIVLDNPLILYGIKHPSAASGYDAYKVYDVLSKRPELEGVCVSDKKNTVKKNKKSEKTVSSKEINRPYEKKSQNKAKPTKKKKQPHYSMPKGYCVNIGTDRTEYSRIGLTEETINSDVLFSKIKSAAIITTALWNCVHFTTRVTLISILLCIFGLPIWLIPLFVIATIALLLCLLLYSLLGTPRITYSYDGQTKDRPQRIKAALKYLKKMRRSYWIKKTVSEDDYKRNAGVSRSVKTDKATISNEKPIFLRTFDKCFCVKAKNECLYVLPNMIVVIKGWGVQIATFDELDVNIYRSPFIVSGLIPVDTEIIGHTYQYVNKDGSADKRYKNNKRIDICEFGELHLSSKYGVNEKFLFSGYSKLKEFYNMLYN